MEIWLKPTEPYSDPTTIRLRSDYDPILEELAISFHLNIHMIKNVNDRGSK